ncbi:MAG: hypothetical protein IT306_17870 [Chloroflexi bacterium]|nr:hypothetical protein [Chloroflexota bacterium]
MAWGMLIGGLSLNLVGALWILQGLNVLGGSFMSGQSVWAVVGLVAMVSGLVLQVVGLRRRSEER